MELKEYKLFTEELLKQAGKIALRYFRKSPETKSKDDGSLVTQADKEIEKFIRKNIAKKFKDHSILGEEDGFDNKKSNHLWVIDPIDGTASFAAGKPMWGIMIGLVIDDVPVLGAVYQPFLEEMWLGIGTWELPLGKKRKICKFKTYYNGKEIKSQISNPKFQIPKILTTTGPQYFDEKGSQFFAKLSKKADNVIYGGDCYNYCMLANGYISMIYEQNLKPHDYIPLLPILLGVGAKVTDEKGNFINDLTRPQSLLVTRG